MSKKPTTSEARTQQSTSTVLFGALIGVTWRMFVPQIVGVMIGLWIDATLSSAPWVTIACVIAAFVISGLLVKQQIHHPKEAA